MSGKSFNHTVDPLDATLVIQLGYRGAGFCGFAKQQGCRTVAGVLSDALETFFRRKIDVTCAGRTDAGVHAQGQVVSVPITHGERLYPERRIIRGLSALTPDDLSIRGLYRAPAGFSARFDAEARTYRYRIATGECRPILAWDHAWWHRAQLDVAAMNESAQCLCGEHDFKSFCKSVSSIDRRTHRHIEHIGVERIAEAGEILVAVDITGNAFLHTMVRTIVGTLVEVGCGRRSKNWVRDVLSACDRRRAGMCAPAKGLTFVGVRYPRDAFLPWERHG